MGVRINHNTTSIQLRHNLDTVNRSLEGVFERLSSGERINRSGDDVAGLAVSQNMRNDIRGFRQNMRNVNDGISVTSTAESVLGKVTGILNRIRELAIASGSVIMTDNDRNNNDLEVQELIQEIGSLAEQTEFNGKRLLDGTYQNMRIQRGVSSGQYVTVSIPDMSPLVLGAFARDMGSTPVGETAIVNSGDLVVNGEPVPPTMDDGVSTWLPDTSAIAKANAINGISGDTGVTATVEPAEIQGLTPIQAVSINGTTSVLVINGVPIGPVDVQDRDGNGNLAASINVHSQETGVRASVAADGSLVLTAEDGRNVRIETTGGVAQSLGLTAGADDLTVTGSITLSSEHAIQLGGDPSLIGFDAAQAFIDIDPTTALSFLNVTSYEDAQRAIETVDAAMSQVISTRSNLGAVQNRLEKTVDHLAVVVEELSASDSDIRDTDVALESARLARDQIVQQAGVAILAQANAMPRNILEMLMR